MAEPESREQYLWRQSLSRATAPPVPSLMGPVLASTVLSALVVGSVWAGCRTFDITDPTQQMVAMSLAGLGSIAMFAASLGFVGGETSEPIDVKLTRPVSGDGTEVDEPAPGGLKGVFARRCSLRVKDLVTTLSPTGIRTVDGLFREAARAFPSDECMGSRVIHSAFLERTTYTTDDGEEKVRDTARFHLGEWEWETFADIDAQMDLVALGLVKKLGLAPKENVMMYAETSKLWQLCLHGCMRANAVVATAYATLGLPALAFSINLTDATTLFADRTLLEKLVKVMDGADVEGKFYDLKCLKRVVVIDNLLAHVPEERTKAEAAIAKLGGRSATSGGPIEVVDLEAVMKAGKAYTRARDAILEAEERQTTPEDTAVIMFTSGSTGMPKGVVVLHRNLSAGMAGMAKGTAGIGKGDTLMGYLPLAHILALAAEHVVLCLGGRIGYGTTKTLTSTMPAVKGLCDGDVPTLEPSIMAGVPEIFNRFLAGVRKGVAAKGAIATALFERGVKAKIANVEARGVAGITHPFWDAILFKAIREKALGRNMRMFISGGGPLPEDTQRFISVVFCCPISQGYGLTETCGAGTVGWSDDVAVKNAGVVLQCNQIKLVPWDEAGYSPDASPPTGEVCFSGGNVTAGYFKNPAKTASDFRKHDDGRIWFHSGDIGRWEANGTLSIIDRKKDLVKFSGGEYVSFGKVESELKTLDFLAFQCLVGDSTRKGAILLCVPDFTVLPKYIPDTEGLSREEVVSRADVKAFVLAQVKARSKQRSLERFETPLTVILLADDWTPESGLLTAALKLRRKQISTAFAELIEGAYASL